MGRTPMKTMKRQVAPRAQPAEGGAAGGLRAESPMAVSARSPQTLALREQNLVQSLGSRHRLAGGGGVGGVAATSAYRPRS